MRLPDAFSLLVDPDRLAVAGALAARSLTADGLVEHTGRDRRTVLTALGDLRQAGLVGVDADTYSLDVAALRALARQAAEVDVPMDPTIGYGMTDDERAVLERFFSGRVLTEFPQSRPKQQVVLQRLALEFDVGRHYTEAEVNDVLHEFHTDWSTLRRHLVDEQLLDREHRDGQTVYWRSGGRVVS
ncbi:MAG TPA: DUF2087 domain-containing protein [Ilumatobacter sp.]|nr:DUF2087 domain-containing protein [Ilumatobacter sp.]